MRNNSNQIKRLLGLPVRIEDNDRFMALANLNTDALTTMTLSQRGRFNGLVQNIYEIVQNSTKNNKEVVSDILGFAPHSDKFQGKFNCGFNMWGLEIGTTWFLFCMDETRLERQPQLVLITMPVISTEEIEKIIQFLEASFCL